MFDRITLTARDEAQANRYRQALLPRWEDLNFPQCHVEPDEPEGCGSAETTRQLIQGAKSNHSELIIHCGGESTRRPECKDAGKCFQPYEGRTLLECLVESLSAWELPPGVLVCAGDVFYSAPQPEFDGNHAAIWGHEEDGETVAQHALLTGRDGVCLEIIQKPTMRDLAKCMSDKRGILDTGLMWLSPTACQWYLRSDWTGKDWYRDAVPQIVRTFCPTLFCPQGARWEHLG